MSAASATQAPFFSIITVCYNSEKTIRDTLESVAAQTVRDFEYLIIDGGSSDATLDIVRSYEDRLPKDSLTVVSEPDNGVYDAMNKGISYAKGKLVGIINSDDWYEKDTLEKVQNAYQGNRYEVIYGMLDLYNPDGTLRQTHFSRHEDLDKMMIGHPTNFVTLDAYRDLGTYNIQYRYAADQDLMLGYYLGKKVTFTPVKERLASMRLGGISDTIDAGLEADLVLYNRRVISWWELQKRKYRAVFRR
ncbi:MAG: glycosyltransferase [Lachnospiraceae bacterium]|nr:glycosyltransferase [Lachnospiraceae bacterium]